MICHQIVAQLCYAICLPRNHQWASKQQSTLLIIPPGRIHWLAEFVDQLLAKWRVWTRSLSFTLGLRSSTHTSFTISSRESEIPTAFIVCHLNIISTGCVCWIPLGNVNPLSFSHWVFLWFCFDHFYKGVRYLSLHVFRTAISPPILCVVWQVHKMGRSRVYF